MLDLKKTKVGRAKDFLSALYSDKVGGLANYISYNYYTDPLTGQPVLDEKGQPMLLQTYLEKKWNKPPGYFSNEAAPKNYKGDGSDLGYYYQTTWAMQDGTTVLDMTKMKDEIGYYVMLASSRVANSEKEWREHKWPKAQWYIAHENESNELKYNKKQTIAKAYTFINSSEFTESLKRKAVSILELVSSKPVLTTEQVFNTLCDYIDAGNASNLEKLLNISVLLKTKDGKEKFEAMWILKQALDNYVVWEKQGTYTWKKPNGEPLVIGERYAEAIDFIVNPKKSAEVEEIQAQIKAKLQA